MLKQALNYAKNASIIPLKPRDKRPLLSSWEEFKTRRATAEEITKWFENCPEANIAIVCGKISGYTVIDLDVKDFKGDNLLEYARQIGFPDTLTIKTPTGGYHLYYQYTDKWKTGVRVFDNVDVRNDSSYIVLPPSIHPNGGKYEVYRNMKAVSLPESLVPNQRDKKDFLDLGGIINGVGAGNRNDTAAKIIGLYLNKLDPLTAWQMTCAWNDRNSPPMSEHELKVTFNSILKRDQKKIKEEKQEAQDWDRKFQLVSLSDLIDRSMKELDATKAEECISFGYDFLDEKLTGLFPGELVVLGGASGTGKTTLGTKIIYKACEKGAKAAILALEDRLVDYGIKAIYYEIGKLRKAEMLKNYPWNDYRKNQIDDSNYIKYRKLAEDNIKKGDVYFIEVKEMMNIELLEAILEQLTLDGFQLFLIDHLHYFDLMKGDDNKANYVEHVMIRIKQLQNKTGARVILIAHYKKLNGQKPSDDSFKDSMAIAQNANYTIHLWRDKQAEGDDRYYTKMTIAKSRNPNGEANLEIKFDPQTSEYIIMEAEKNLIDKNW